MSNFFGRRIDAYCGCLHKPLYPLNSETGIAIHVASLALSLIVAGIAIPIFVPDGSQALEIGQNVVAVLSLATDGTSFIVSIVLEDQEVR